MTYDALNRLIRRVTPQVDYAQTACTPGTIDCRWVFPYYPNNGTGLRISADTAVFAYDVAGNMTQADNGDARIRRTYTKSGWLATDSLWLRSYGSTSFITNRWGLTIRYDSLGRRRSLRHPSNLYNHDGVSTRDSVVYIYHAATGALQEVRDLANRSYTYTDDPAGRPVKLEARNTVGGAVGVKDSSVFDPDSRVLERKVYLAGSGSPSIMSSGSRRGGVPIHPPHYVRTYGRRRRTRGGPAPRGARAIA